MSEDNMSKVPKNHEGQAIEEVEGVQVVVDYEYVAFVKGTKACKEMIFAEPDEPSYVIVRRVCLPNDGLCVDLIPLMRERDIEWLEDHIREEVEEA